MTLTMHNTLMRFASPTVQAILLGLAIAVMSLTTRAQETEPPLPHPTAIQLIVIDNPGCPACQKFNAEVGQNGFDTHKFSSRATMSFIVSGATNNPEWFLTAYRDGRVKQIQYTPTFIFMALTSSGESREVGRFVGYRDRDWFFNKVEEMLNLIEPHIDGLIFKEGDGDELYWDKSHSEVQEFDRKRSV